jgi:hypothetical protein
LEFENGPVEAEIWQITALVMLIFQPTATPSPKPSFAVYTTIDYRASFNNHTNSFSIL